MVISRNAASIAAGVFAVAAGSSVAGQAYVEVFTNAQLDNGNGDVSLRSAVADGTTVYALSGDFSPVDLLLTKVTSGGTTVLADLASTQTTVPSQTDDPFPGFGMGVVGNAVQIIDSASDAVYRYDTTSGTASLFVSSAQIAAATGEASASVRNNSGTTTTGDAVFLEDISGDIMIATAPGIVSTLIDSALLPGISTGITADTAGNYYWGDGATDTVYKFDGLAVTPVISPLDFGPVGSAIGMDGDFFFAPDGLIYFRSRINGDRGIQSFDPDAIDPGSTLTTVLSATELSDGPFGSTFVNEITWYDGNLAFSGFGSSGFYAIPEPAGVALLAAGVAVLGLRRLERALA
jgi:hypothetical protein